MNTYTTNIQTDTVGLPYEHIHKNVVIVWSVGRCCYCCVVVVICLLCLLVGFLGGFFVFVFCVCVFFCV